MDVSAFTVTAAYDAHLPVGALSVKAAVRASASTISEPGVEVSLRLWTPRGATVAVLREISPATRDLRDRAVRLDDRTVEYPAGCWVDGIRDYELAVALPARGAGDEMLAARLDLTAEGEVVAGAQIAVTWAADAESAGIVDESAVAGGVAVEELSTGLSPRPRHMLVLDESAAGEPCLGCGLRAAAGDRFCERCGRRL